MGIELIFDEKPEVKAHVDLYYRWAAGIANDLAPGKFETLTFASDDQVLPLQAADLFTYEWRKRTSDKRNSPDKPLRTSYRRLRERLDAEDRALLHHYNEAAMIAITRETGDVGNLLKSMWQHPTTVE
jgi:hypothetical protein